MPGAKSWGLKPRTFALSTLLYEHAKSAIWIALLTPCVFNSRTNHPSIGISQPSHHLHLANKAKCLEFPCSTRNRNETSERIARASVTCYFTAQVPNRRRLLPWQCAAHRRLAFAGRARISKLGTTYSTYGNLN